MNQTINNTVTVLIFVQVDNFTSYFPVAVPSGVVFLPQERLANAKTDKQDSIFRSHFFFAQYKFILTLRSASFVFQKKKNCNVHVLFNGEFSL